MKYQAFILFSFFVLLLTKTEAFSMERIPVRVTDTIYSADSVDKKPEPVKGMFGLYKQMAKTFRYPAYARENGIQGEFRISVVIDERGELIDVQIEKGLGYGMDEEVINSIKRAKIKWISGEKNDRKVKTRLVFPLKIGLS